MAEEVVKRPLIDKSITNLSDDILIEIFLKLPVRTLFSFRSVSKHWLSLIQNPNFIKLHLNRSVDHSKTQNPLLVLQTVKSKPKPRTRNPTLYSTKNVINFLCDGDKTLDDYKDEVALELILPNSTGFGIGDGEVHLMGPCNGLFCITDTVDVALFNPATRKCRKLPPPPSRDAFDSVGFGYDSISNNYKVVRFDEIIQDPNNDDDDDDDDDDKSVYDNDRYSDFHYRAIRGYKVEIFSLSTKCWREVESVVPAANMAGLFRYNVFTNGAFHWLQGCDNDSILVFDLHKESFKQFELPYKVTTYSIFKVSLSVWNEYLAIVLYSLKGFVIRVMMEYGVTESWKVINATGFAEIDRPLSFSGEEEFLLQKRDGKLILFDRVMKARKEIEVQGVMGPVYAFRYRESLVLL